MTRKFLICLFGIIFINGCGSSSDGEKLINELNLKCSSINLSKMQANCSMAKRGPSENNLCDSGNYDRMSDKELSKEIKSLEKAAANCSRQMKGQSRWLW